MHTHSIYCQVSHYQLISAHLQLLHKLFPVYTTVNVSRALTRLKSVFVSLSNVEPSGTLKEVNNFFHPMGIVYDKVEKLCFEIQIGAIKYPKYLFCSLAEAFYQLRKALGLQSVNALMAINPTEYREKKFVIGIDTEKVLASFSGYNSWAGDLTVLRLKPTEGDIRTAGTLKLHYVLHSDSIMQIMDSGVSVLE